MEVSREDFDTKTKQFYENSGTSFCAHTTCFKKKIFSDFAMMQSGAIFDFKTKQLPYSAIIWKSVMEISSN